MKLAFVQEPTARQLADALAASERGVIDPFLDDLANVRSELIRRGVEVRSTYSGEDLPPLCGLRPDEIFPFGGLTTMWRWMERFGWQHRIAPSYPACLDGYLHRRTWRGVPAALLAGPAAAVKPVFVKTCRPCFPDGERFEGRIWPSLELIDDLHPSLTDETFLCSETVPWVSEYRCYVIQGRLAGIHPYQLLGTYCGPVDGSDLERHVPDIRPDPDLVTGAIARLEASGEATDGYALDFGRIAHGPMSLVEMNDGVALTNYGLAIGDHLDLHLHRWRQLAGAAGA